MTELQDTDTMIGPNKNQSISKAIAGIRTFFLGSFLGILTGILLAPRSGQDTRIKIKQKAHDALDKGHNKMGDILDQATEKVKQAGEKTTQVAKQAVSRVKTPEPALDSK